MQTRRAPPSTRPEGPKRGRGRPRTFDREVVLDRAMRLFWERGYDSTSISDLTAAMGITAPTLYALFGDKQGLFLAAVDRYQAGPGGYGCVALDEPTARRAMERLMRETINSFFETGNPKGCMVALAATNCTPESVEVSRNLAERRRTGERMIRGRILAGRKAGELPAETDVDALSGMVMNVLYGLSIQARDGASRSALLKIVAQVMQAWPGHEAGSSKGNRATRGGGKGAQ